METAKIRTSSSVEPPVAADLNWMQAAIDWTRSSLFPLSLEPGEVAVI
ncbi:hypothetical protein [Rhodophyticola porphyridii]|nr:hypothetical protein [Rhodophyticola porphyridii]